MFDGNCPIQGLIDAADPSAAWFLWCRRGMWRAGSGAKFLERERHFDAVLEPRDLAERFDAALTAAAARARGGWSTPILLLDGTRCWRARRPAPSSASTRSGRRS